MVRRLRPVLVVAVLAAIWAPVLAGANADLERLSADLIVRERAAAAVPAYGEQPDLADVARRHAQRMAAEHRLYHNPNLANDVQGWDAVGENVGRGPSVDAIHRAFMDSPPHRSEILSTSFTQFGVGVAVADDGEVWIAQVFRKPTAAPAPAPAPDAAATPAPASTRRQPAIVRPSRASSPATPAPPVAAAPAPPPPAPPTTTTTVIVAPDLTALDRAFLPAPVIRPRLVDAEPVLDVEPDVQRPVRIAATLLVLVVALQTRYVVGEMGGLRLAIPLRTRLAASAATLP